MSEKKEMTKTERLRAKRASVLAAGGKEKIDKQHRAGKMTARERLEALYDGGTFLENQSFVEHRCGQFGMEGQEIPGDGVLTGTGLINGRTVFAFSQDFTCAGGSVGEMHAKKIVNIMRDALKCGAPVIGISCAARKSRDRLS